jgi:integrase/recombinase XerD
MRDKKPPVALDAAINRFVAHQRAFGCAYTTQEYTLRTLQRFVTRQCEADLSAGVYEQWCRLEQRLSPNTRYLHQVVVRKFCLFRQRQEPRCFVPDPTSFTRPQPYRSPVIVTPEQIAGLLRAADALSTLRYSLRPDVMRMAIVLLYTCGLRRGELIRLQLADVDIKQGVLHIRDSKFHKSRWVPLSAGGRLELRRYLRKRLKEPYDLQPAASFIGNPVHSYGFVGWHAFSGAGITRALKKLFDLAGVRGSDGRRLCVQDIRHNFAIQALSRWYRQGADVQTHLPKLALYMGHVSIVSTAYYLHFTPEIASLASERFGRHYAHVIQSGDL